MLSMWLKKTYLQDYYKVYTLKSSKFIKTIEELHNKNY